MSAAEEEALLRELRGAAEKVANRGAAAEAPVCSVCGAALPSAHLLSLHISEAHDSFFAAQAARKLKVQSVHTARQRTDPPDRGAGDIAGGLLHPWQCHRCASSKRQSRRPF